MIGDGESQEGQIWEAALSAPKFKLDNLVCILDYNKAQIDGFVSEVMPIEPIADKWKAFGWHVISIDGHDYNDIVDAFDEASSTKGKPTFIIADTVKRKGISFLKSSADGNDNSKGCPPPKGGFNIDFSPMLFYDSLHNGQS